MRKKMIIVIVMGVISVFLLSIILVVSYAYSTWDNIEHYSYQYTMEIYPSDNGEFTLCVPIPINVDGSVSEILSTLKTKKGDVSYHINETDKGYALKVTGTGEALLESYGEKQVPEAWLNLLNYTNETSHQDYYWVYCNKSSQIENITIKIRCNINYWVEIVNKLGLRKPSLAAATHKSYLCGYVKQNEWQLVQGSHGTVVV